MNPIIKSNLDFLERERIKTETKLASFKSKQPKKVVKDASSILKKVVEIQKENEKERSVLSIEGNIEKRVRPLKEIKKNKPVVWL